MEVALRWLKQQWKPLVGCAAGVGFVVLLCFMFCTHETVVRIEGRHWQHTVALEEYHTYTHCGAEMETDTQGQTRTVNRCHTDSSWDTVNVDSHEGEDFTAPTWPPTPVAGYGQRVVKRALYTVRVSNTEGQWKHRTTNLPWAQRLKPGGLWLARVNRAGWAWPERPAGAEAE